MPRPVLFALAAAIAALPASAQPVLYVDADAVGANTGASWDDAFPDLQDALAAARTDASVEEVWIAEGVYTPTDDDDRSVSFDLVSGVGLYGGFDGTEASRDEAEPVVYLTVLSGSIGPDAGEQAQRASHVVRGIGLEDLVVLDGLTVEGGLANGSTPIEGQPSARWASGGGVLLVDSQVSLQRCRLVENSAVLGGGMAAFGSDLAVTSVEFSSNLAPPLPDLSGAGVYIGEGTTARFEGVAFVGNAMGTYEGGKGGGLAVTAGAVATVEASSFTRNSGALFASGAGAWCNGDCVFNDVLFVGNRGAFASEGGGLRVGLNGDALVQNVRFYGNEAGAGAGVASSGTLDLRNALLAGNSTVTVSGPADSYGGGGLLVSRGVTTATQVTLALNAVPAGGLGHAVLVRSGGSATLANFISWPLQNAIAAGGSGALDLSHGIAENGIEGEALLALDPRLVRPPAPGPDGVWGTADDDYGDLTITDESPAIDAGSLPLLPSDALDLDGDGDTQEPLPFDLAGADRVRSGEPDLGAYESPFDAVPPTLGPTLFVDADAAGDGDGSGWADAFPDLQSALDAARQSPLVEEIWIAEGTYYPTSGADRTVSFDLVGGVGLYGGFGGTEAERDAADPVAHPVVLSGDIGVDDDRTDNSHQVVRAVNLADTTRLGGVRVQHGRADLRRASQADNGVAFGAGVSAEAVTLVLSHVTIADNSAYVNGDGSYYQVALGAGLHARSATVLLDSVRIARNSASGSYGGRGGGLYASGSEVLIERSVVEQNSASGPGSGVGGGLYVTGGSALVASSLIRRNGVGDAGTVAGGIYCASACTLQNSHVVSNGAGQYGHGGGIYNAGSLTVSGTSFFSNGGYGGGAIASSGSGTVTNSVFYGNRAYGDIAFVNFNGAALLLEGGQLRVSSSTFAGNRAFYNQEDGRSFYVDEGELNLSNVIVRDDSIGVIWQADDASSSVSYALIPGGYAPGDGIIDADPLFVREPSPGPDGQWGTDDDSYGDLRIQWDSPAVDAGDASLLPSDVLDLDGDGDAAEPLPLDADGTARVQGTALDLGAYESPFNVAAEDEAPLPAALALAAAPNPFTATAQVTLALPVASEARVAAYDVLGREVAVLHEGPLEAGQHPMLLGTGLAPGLYLVRAEAGDGAATLRVTKSR